MISIKFNNKSIILSSYLYELWIDKSSVYNAIIISILRRNKDRKLYKSGYIWTDIPENRDLIKVKYLKQVI